MSMHKQAKSPELRQALIDHRLPVDTPSQMTDTFCAGWQAALVRCAKVEPAALLQQVLAALEASLDGVNMQHLAFKEHYQGRTRDAPHLEKLQNRVATHTAAIAALKAALDQSCATREAVSVQPDLSMSMFASKAEYEDAKLAQSVQPRKGLGECEWSLEDEESGTWASSCGELWGFNDGGPKENRVTYCHHCGKLAVGVVINTKELK